MTQNVPILLWHYAVSGIHRQVALASFLVTTQAAQVHVYYPADDAAALLIADTARQVNVRATPWEPTHTSIAEDWTWICSHGTRCLVRPLGAHSVSLRAVLCLGPIETDTFFPQLPSGHEFFITGQPIHTLEAKDPAV